MINTDASPLTDFFQRQGVMMLDGGLASALEARGHDLNDPLWSAKVLLESPDSIRDVHLDYLTAGADCIITSSYQASITGLREHGLSAGEAEEALRRSVDLARQARDEFWSAPRHRTGRLRPLVAASVGPFGAAQADGSEYTGAYPIDDDQLLEFHRRRWEVLADTGADLLACETIPTWREAHLYLRLLDQSPHTWAWLSFSCRDGRHLSDGTALVDAARKCDAHPQVAALGVNCTAPAHMPSLLREARRGSSKPLIAYPNSGERFHAGDKAWGPAPAAVDWVQASAEWAQLGAVCIGGCCRVGAREIAAMRSSLLGGGG